MYLKAKDESVSSLIFRSSCSGAISIHDHESKNTIKSNSWTHDIFLEHLDGFFPMNDIQRDRY